MLDSVLRFVAGYLLGSLTFCRILAGFRKKDLGNNFGAMSYYSVTRDPFGVVFCALFDFLKGAISFAAFGPLGAIGAVVGHLWSIFFGFKGGRGGAVAFGIFSIADPKITAVFVGYSILRFILIRDKTMREKIDQIFRALLIVLLPFLPYTHKWLLWWILVAITVKYQVIGCKN